MERTATRRVAINIVVANNTIVVARELCLNLTYLFGVLITTAFLAHSEVWSGMALLAATTRGSALSLGARGLFLWLRSLGDAFQFFL